MYRSIASRIRSTRLPNRCATLQPDVAAWNEVVVTAWFCPDICLQGVTQP